MGATASEKLAARTKSKNNGPLEKKDEVVANVIWRFLELRGYTSLYVPSIWFDSQVPIFWDRFLINSHVHSPLARAMYTAVRGARVNDKFQDSLYLFLELIRAGVMHGHLWSHRAFSGGPSFGTGWLSLLSRVRGCAPFASVGSRVKPFSVLFLAFRPKGSCYRITDFRSTDDEKSCMLLIMRVLSIVPLSFKVRYFTASQLCLGGLIHNTLLLALGRFPNLTAASMVSPTLPGTSRL